MSCHWGGVIDLDHDLPFVYLEEPSWVLKSSQEATRPQGDGKTSKPLTLEPFTERMSGDEGNTVTSTPRVLSLGSPGSTATFHLWKKQTGAAAFRPGSRAFVTII